MRYNISDEYALEYEDPEQSMKSMKFLKDYFSGILKAYGISIAIYVLVVFAMETIIKYHPSLSL